jgi:hypothetical protein
MSLLKLTVDFGTLFIGAEGVRLLREGESKGGPTHRCKAPRRLPDRPQKANAKALNQQPSLTELKYKKTTFRVRKWFTYIVVLCRNPLPYAGTNQIRL